MAREQKYKHRRVGGVVVEVFLFVTPLCRSPALVKKSPLNLSLEYKQLNKLTFSAVVFPQNTSEFRQLLATSAWFVWPAQFSRCCWTLLLLAAWDLAGERAEQLWF